MTIVLLLAVIVQTVLLVRLQRRVDALERRPPVAAATVAVAPVAPPLVAPGRYRHPRPHRSDGAPPSPARPARPSISKPWSAAACRCGSAGWRWSSAESSSSACRSRRGG
ncbi:hypothetical protein ACVOMT_09345 [Sphingomonas panni]